MAAALDSTAATAIANWVRDTEGMPPGIRRNGLAFERAFVMRIIIPFF
jgi:hypothetical protein